ncbi:hypothetical protein VP1G_07875 [Cytospora mali]|uniref:Uncharacterized protein n=1 Tax=Cytospora mali TaxID=578113 RepID=A0A194V9V2_CYTMA|nr:hypothetical protein VP1G_07875 [Valsa mali var. pyri (nom. inval.)]
MATALLLLPIITAAVLALIARPLFSTRPAAEFSSSSSTSASTSQQYPVPLPKGYHQTVEPKVAEMSTPICPDDDTNNDRFRSQFVLGPGVDVKGLPARGGRYMLIEATGVELDFLGLDRFHDAERPPGVDAGSPDEEAHCARMRQLGATWWSSTHDYVEWRLGDIGDSPYVKVGWPAGGGVWVLSTTYNEAGDRGVAIIHNAYNMEERCKALEKLGAVFYENPRDCQDLDLP